MIDLKRWIYSPDIAQWLSGGRALNLDEQIDCILSAPHKNLEEKLEGLRGPVSYTHLRAHETSV